MGGERLADYSVPASEGTAAVNYRHHFHAGNFADLVKHALWLELLRRAKAAPGPITVIDTHAGAGMYDLMGDAARRSGEAEQGIVRLMADAAAPAVFDPLKTVVRRLNPDGTVRLYPGSPALTLGALGRGDRYEGCELRPDDQAALAALLAETRTGVEAQALRVDGYARLAAARPGKGRLLALIDPPFEQADDYRRIIETTSRSAAETTAVWLPLKDLETFDAFIEGLEVAGVQGFVVEVRLRPLSDPMKMNGCAMAVLGRGAAGLEADALAIGGWVAATGGGAGAARIVGLAG